MNADPTLQPHKHTQAVPQVTLLRTLSGNSSVISMEAPSEYQHKGTVFDMYQHCAHHSA
jgi:hypothetical protein